MFDLSKYPDRKNLKRIDTRNAHGWQFATKKTGFEETKFFSDGQCGSPDAAYDAAKQYRNDVFEAARELGIGDEDGFIADQLPISLNISARNNTGIIGVNRSTHTKKNRKTQDLYWVANYKTDDGEHRQEKCSIPGPGEKQALMNAVAYRRAYVARVCQSLSDSVSQFRVETHLDELDDILEYIAALESDADVFFFIGTLNNPLLNSTDKHDMIKLRIRQQRFRRTVLDYWGRKCVITGAANMLTAAHIKPWAKASDVERLDVFNGLVLSPVYDRAFDLGLITFGDDGAIDLSDAIKSDCDALGITGDERLPAIDSRTLPYLAWHRANVYRAR